MGSSRDESVTSVSALLNSYGIESVILECFLRTDIDNDSFSESGITISDSCVDIDIEILPSGKSKYYIYGQELEEGALFWDKVKLSSPGNPMGVKEKNAINWYRTNEWNGFYNFIRSLFPDKIYNPPHITQNMIKPFQQKLAADAGFLVPHTHIVTRKHYIEQFYDQHRLLVMKTLNNTDIIPKEQFEPNYSIMTTPFSREMLNSANYYSFYACPHYVQQYIEKLYELRIIYINGFIFSFKIDSQKYEYTKYDWRHGNSMNIFSPIELDSNIKKKINDFANKINLFSGNFDFIVDDNDDIWFLEFNQNGAWMWLDRIVDGEITKAFADALNQKFEVLRRLEK